MGIKHYPLFTSSGVHGNAPVEWYGKDPVNGDVGNWSKAPVGSRYIYKPSESAFTNYVKVLNEQRDSDWVVTDGMFAQRIERSDAWTDGGGASGTLVLGFTIPAGVTVTKTLYNDIVGFTGNTSATLTIGDGTDADRYMTGTPSVFTTAAGGVSAGAVSGTAFHAAAIATVTATLAGNSDFGLITAGAVTVVIFYQA